MNDEILDLGQEVIIHPDTGEVVVLDDSKKDK